MAWDWIPMRLDLRDELEVLSMAGDLGIDPDLVVGKLLRMWGWFNKRTEDGNARGVTFVTLDCYLQCDGFCAAMQKAGWLIVDETDEKSLSIPDFDTWNSSTAKKRKRNAMRQQRFRDSDGESEGEEDNTDGVTEVTPERYEPVTDSVTKNKNKNKNNSNSNRDNKNNSNTGKSGSAKADGYPHAFLEFWKAYPKKAGKRPAMEAWKKSVARVPEEQANLVTTDHDGSSNQKLWRQIEYVRQQAEAYGKSAIAQTHPANPATWLNQDRWADDPEAWEVDYNGSGKDSQKTFEEVIDAMDLSHLEDEE